MKQKIIGLLAAFLFSAWTFPALAAVDPELYYPPPYKSKNYTVQKGDCLSLIAQRFYGDMNKWKVIHKMNPWIEDPNYIEIGWVIAVAKAEINKKDYIEWVREDLKRKAFKICHLDYVPENILVAEIRDHLFLIDPGWVSSVSPHYYISHIDKVRPLLRKLEIHDVINCIMTVGAAYEWHDIFYLLAAVAWKESSFRNKDGLHGEKGYWQWRIETALLLRPDIDRKILLYRLEFDTQFSAILTYTHLTEMVEERGSWRKALAGYNGSGDSARQYATQVIAKFHRLKRMK